MAKKGRKPRCYVTPDGETINGLSLRKRRGAYSFYPVGKDSPCFGSSDDPALAIHKFRVWQAQLSGEIEPLDPDPINWGLDNRNKQYWRNYYRDLILSNPKQAAIDLDCEPLALLANAELLTAPDTHTMQEVLQAYLDSATIKKQEQQYTRSWWSEFIEITRVINVVDLSFDIFKQYRTEIQARQEKENLSNKWVRNKFGKIKRVLGNAKKELNLSERERRAIDYCELLKLPSRKKTPAVDISPAEMKKILSHCDPLEKAIVLVALNSAYLPSDIHSLRWDMIDFRKRFIRFDRAKSEKLTADEKPIPRCSYLWKRTIDALKAIKTEYDHVFISSRGKPIHGNTICKRFGSLVNKAGIKPKRVNNELVPITFRFIRKSSLTAAANTTGVSDRQIKLLGGHSEGIQDVYVVPRNVQLACEAIEKYYFGKCQKDIN